MTAIMDEREVDTVAPESDYADESLSAQEVIGSDLANFPKIQEAFLRAGFQTVSCEIGEDEFIGLFYKVRVVKMDRANKENRFYLARRLGKKFGFKLMVI